MAYLGQVHPIVVPRPPLSFKTTSLSNRFLVSETSTSFVININTILVSERNYKQRYTSRNYCLIITSNNRLIEREYKNLR